MDKQIEEYPFGYFLATLNSNRRNSYCESLRETRGRYIELLLDAYMYHVLGHVLQIKQINKPFKS